MKYCDKCGTELEDNMLFCPNCGTESITPSTTQVTEPVTNPSQNTTVISYNNINEQSNKNIGRVLAAIICIVVFFLIISVIAIFKNHSNKTANIKLDYSQSTTTEDKNRYDYRKATNTNHYEQGVFTSTYWASNYLHLRYDLPKRDGWKMNVSAVEKVNKASSLKGDGHITEMHAESKSSAVEIFSESIPIKYPNMTINEIAADYANLCKQVYKDISFGEKEYYFKSREPYESKIYGDDIWLVFDAEIGYYYYLNGVKCHMHTSDLQVFMRAIGNRVVFITFTTTYNAFENRGYLISYLSYYDSYDTPEGESTPMICTASGTNIRITPQDGGIIGEVSSGDTVYVYREENGWYLIKYGEIVGWSTSKFFSKDPPSTSTTTTVPATTTQPQVTLAEAYGNESNQYATVSTNGGNLNMRSGPGQNYSVIGKVPNGATVVITNSSDTWYYIEYNGQSGWASGDWLVVDTY